MSSPKAAAAKAASAKSPAKSAAAKPAAGKAAAGKSAGRAAADGKPKLIVAAKPKAAPATGLSAEAIRLAAEIEREFAKHDDAISAEAMQALMGALCRVYSAQVEAGATFTPIEEGQVVSPTGVMVTASGLLRAANLAVFELGMWQSWTGR
jgi:hypothetical protein